MNVHYISDAEITVKQVIEICSRGKKLELSQKSKNSIQECRDFLDAYLEKSDSPVYGINTGFGALHNTQISREN